MDECGEKNTISLSWGRREIRISGEGATLYVNGVPHDMTICLLYTSPSPRDCS